MQLELPVLADGQDAEAHCCRVGAKFRLLKGVGGQLGKELVEAAVVIGEAPGLVGCQGEVGPSQPAEERAEKALLKQAARRVPLLLAAEGQLVKAAAGAPGGKDEPDRIRLRADGDGTAGPAVTVERNPVEVTVDRLVRIDARTLGAGVSHDLPADYPPPSAGPQLPAARFPALCRRPGRRAGRRGRTAECREPTADCRSDDDL